MRTFVLLIPLIIACNSKSETDTAAQSDDAGTDGFGSGGGSGSGSGGSSDGGSASAGSDGTGDGDDLNTRGGRFLGQMQADTLTVYEAGEVDGVEFPAGEVDAECVGPVSFDLTDSLVLEGTASCSSDTPFLLQFDMEGSQADLTVKGLLSLEIEGETVETVFEGTRDGDEIEVSFDDVHGDDDNRFELAGTITATRVE